MTKKIIFSIAIVAALAVICMALVGCESYKNTTFSMPDTNAPVQSNGGAVVVQGDYIYFINGSAGYLKDDVQANWFGHAVKGAVMRIKTNATDLSTVETIVPKTVYSSAANTGFSIYGDYIYYVSPSVEENRDGSVKTDNLQWLCTRLDGQDTKVILEIENGTSTQYKYTPDGLYYVKDGTLYFKAYASKYKKDKDGTVVAENLTAVYMPVSKTYTKGNTYLADGVLYTKASEDDYDYTNVLYYHSNKTGEKVLIDKNTFTSTPDTDTTNAFSVAVVATRANEDNTLSIAYTKSYYIGASSSGTSAGTFVYRLDNSLNFVKANEKQISTTALSALTLLDNDSVICTSDVMTIYSANAEGKPATPVAFKDDNGSIKSATVVDVVDGYVYYTASELLYRYALDGSTYVQKVGADKACSHFIAAEIVKIGDGVHAYFFDETNKEYLYRYDMTEFDKSGNEAELMGVMTAADKKALEDAKKKEDK